MGLPEIIIERIRKDGPISFRDFMEMSLYHPGSGYYTSFGNKIGKQGDFYTSPYLTSLFGKMVALQLEEMWHLLDKKSFTIVEYGAGTGSLCRDILNHLKKNEGLYHNLRYCIIEKSPAMQEKEKSILHEKVSWHNSIEEVRGMTGCILSNEVVDNFSVHRVVMQDELMEVFVDHDNRFKEVLRPASDKLKDYMEQLKVILPKGFQTEINLQAVDWLTEISSALDKGFMITIDYGYPSFELYRLNRSQGTLVCYHKHQVNYCPYINVGEQDITSHVNFSALYHWGLKNGLEYAGFTSQAYFLLSLGLAEHVRKMEEENTTDPIATRKKAMLIHTFLMDMGNKFKVLIQKKGIQQPALSGLKFCLQL